jgi:hypothetical protein
MQQLEAQNQGPGSHDPLCQCQNSAPSTFTSGTPLPAELAGHDDYAIVKVTIPFVQPVVKYVLTQKQPDGQWLVADLYCTGSPADAESHQHRMTVDPQDG